MIEFTFDATSPFAILIVPLQILVVDLLLSADNALVIALACRGLPEQDVKLVAFLGTLGAIGLRLVMAAAVVLLLRVPLLKILAALALLVIAVRLTLAPNIIQDVAELQDGNFRPAAEGPKVGGSLLQSIGAVVAADAIMSLDNVVALATIANGNLVLLGFGLALSIPMLIWGGTLIRRLLDENRLIVIICGMFLGWLAGGIGVSDPLVGPWVAQNAPALPFAVPVACAIFVMWQTLISASGRDFGKTSMLDDVEDFGPIVVTPQRIDAWRGRLLRRGGGAAPSKTPKLVSAVEPTRTVAIQDAPRSGKLKLPRRLAPTGPLLRVDRILATLVLIVAVWAATGFYKVEPDQVGVVLRFGRFVDKLGPGLHYHLPIPIESVLLPRVTEINELRIGNGAVTQMLTGDENIVEATAAVSWRISDPVKFLFNVFDPEATVRVAAESAVRQVIALNPIQSGLSDQRQKIADDAQSLLQRMLDFYGAGIQITQVQLQRVDPPTAVIDAFNDVQRARADQQRARNEAEAYRNDILPRARGEAERINQETQGYHEQVIDQAQGAAARFLALDEAYKQSRAITARRLYLDTMEEVLKGAGKVVIDPSGKAGASIFPFLSLNGAATPNAPPPQKAVR